LALARDVGCFERRGISRPIPPGAAALPLPALWEKLVETLAVLIQVLCLQHDPPIGLRRLLLILWISVAHRPLTLDGVVSVHSFNRGAISRKVRPEKR